MHFLNGGLYHVYNRGNNRQPIFFQPHNYLFFVRKLREEVAPRASILAYCLMPNHFHLLLCPKEDTDEMMHPLARKLGTVLSSYTQAINRAYQRTGSLFQQQTKAKELDPSEGYGLRCFQYIHYNPMAAGLETTLGVWPYSSLPDYLGTRNGQLPDKELAYARLDLSRDHQQFLKDLEGYRGFAQDTSGLF